MTSPSDGLDLDELEREGEPPKPFVFRLAGKQWTCFAPDDCDWQVALDMDEQNPREVFRGYLGDEQYAEFLSHKVPSWKITKLLELIDQHFSPPGVDQGEGDAS